MSALRRVRRLVVEHPGMRATSRHARALAPLDSVCSLGPRGVYMGDMLYGGGGFWYDPWECYARQLRTGVTDPDLMVWGRKGRGKSATMKVYLRRQWCFGRRIRVIDVHTGASRDEGEYTALMRDLGGTVVRLSRTNGVCLNPLANEEDRHRLLRAIARAVLPRPLTDREPAILNTTLDWVCTSAGEPTLPQVVEALLHPSEWTAGKLATTQTKLRNMAQGVAYALQPLCEGVLRGMFDGPTTEGIDFDAQALSIDLSDVKDAESLGILMSCATAFLQATMNRQWKRHEAMNAELVRQGRAPLPEPKTILLVDESYRILSVPGMGDWLQHNFKVSRKIGQQNIAIVHRPSDLSTSGDDGSRLAKVAEGLVQDCQTFALFYLESDALDDTAELLSLTRAEREVVSTLGPWQALWRVGHGRYVVQTVLGGDDEQITNTNRGMLG